MNERAVASQLKRYFISQGLDPIGKYNVFDHPDDADERTFIIDFAVGPRATKGRRILIAQEEDWTRFQEEGTRIDRVVDDLMHVCAFPSQDDCDSGWRRGQNPNPIVGLAVEIENARTKYFLGSLLAASIAGRWGLLIAPDCLETDRWIQTVRRMIYKGSHRPIPSNILIFKWSRLEKHIRQSDTRNSYRIQSV